MTSSPDVSFYLAFCAGVFSFLSPCVLPLVPSYLAFVTGLSFEELTGGSRGKLRKVVLGHSLLFIAGFSLLFTILGASATLAGQFLAEHKDIIRIVGGILIILFGLFISGVFSLGFLQQEKKFHLRDKPLGYLGSLLVGITFAAGWTPCVGPILSSILLYASTANDVQKGVFLLLSYSLGLGVPFLVCSLALNTFLALFRKTRRYLGTINKVAGGLLIVVGILLVTDSFGLLNEYLSGWLPG